MKNRNNKDVKKPNSSQTLNKVKQENTDSLKINIIPTENKYNNY